MTTSRARVERVAKRARVAQLASRDDARVEDALVVPNIADFVLDPSFLGIERIYPRQLLVLKRLCCIGARSRRSVRVA